jgi:hypothetical protein
VGLWCVKIDLKRAAFPVVICCAIAAGSAFAVIYRPSIAPIAKPDARLFSVDVIQHGAALAAIGDCIVAAAAARNRVVTPEMSMTGDPSGTHMTSMDQPIQIRR